MKAGKLQKGDTIMETKRNIKKLAAFAMSVILMMEMLPIDRAWANDQSLPYELIKTNIGAYVEESVPDEVPEAFIEPENSDVPEDALGIYMHMANESINGTMYGVVGTDFSSIDMPKANEEYGGFILPVEGIIGADFTGIDMPKANVEYGGFIAPIEPIPDNVLPENIVYIKTAAELAAIGGATNDTKYYVLENDIYLEDEWIPIANFRGTFDGQGHSINNLYVLESSGVQYAGLFGSHFWAVTIKNVAVNIGENGLSASVAMSAVSAGGLIAQTGYWGSTITNCYVTGSINATAYAMTSNNATAYAGGLIGVQGGECIITDSYAVCEVLSFIADSLVSISYSPRSYAGGLVGYTIANNNYGLTVKNSFALGSVSSSYDIDSPYTWGYHAGGLVGHAYAYTITNSYSVADVSALGSAGGLIGYIADEYYNNVRVITNCYATGDISAILAGGLLGSGRQCEITNSYATGRITATSDTMSSHYAGGLVGNGACTIKSSHATGDVSALYGSPFAGGLVGYGNSIITNSYSLGNVLASVAMETYSLSAIAGGMVGSGACTITNSYATGNATAYTDTGAGGYYARVNSYAGGLIGTFNESYSSARQITITNCYATGNVSAEAINLYQSAFASTSYAGKLIGSFSSVGTLADTTIESSYSTGEISSLGQESYLGGIVGYSNGSNNLTIKNCYATGYMSSSGIIGGLIGYSSDTIIDNCYTIADISGTTAGGLIGEASAFRATTITNSYTAGNVSASHCSGGLVGSGSTGMTIENCYAMGDVSGSMYAGGLIGYTGSITNITNCSSTGDVYASYSNFSYTNMNASYAGGLIGFIIDRSCVIKNSYSIGIVSNTIVSGARTYSFAGGLVGRSGGYIGYSDAASSIEIENSFSVSDISACADYRSYSYAGGLVGYGANMAVSNSYAAGKISALSENTTQTWDSSAAFAGGLAGYAAGTGITTENSYAVAELSALSSNHHTGFYTRSSYTGGLTGFSTSATIKNSYAACTLSAVADGLDAYWDNTYEGGLTGSIGNPESSSAVNSYYDEETADCEDNGFGLPMATEQMKEASSYIDYDFAFTWAINPSVNNGYPYLQALLDSYGMNENMGRLSVTIPDPADYLGYLMRLTAPGYSRGIYVSGSATSFSLLQRDVLYRAELLSPNGVSFAVLENIDLSSSNNVSVSFDYLPAPKNVAISVKGSDYTNITSGFTINWHESGSTGVLATGFLVNGVKSGMNLTYEITLGTELSGIYETPPGGSITVSDNNAANVIEIVLKEIQRRPINGHVKNNGEAVANAEVTVTSRLGSAAPYEITVKTDASGVFSAEAYSGTVRISASKYGFADYARIITAFEGGAVPDIELKKIEGLYVILNMEYTSSCIDGEVPLTTTMYSTRNISFAMRNTTQNIDITDFDLSGMNIVMPVGSANPGDIISVTAADETGEMADAIGSFIVRATDNDVTLCFVQNGSWKADVNSKSTENMALLYDSNGLHLATYTGKYQFAGKTLPQGDYTVVFIAASKLLRQLGQLSDFDMIGLADGADYIKRSFSVTAGIITVIDSVNIPVLNEVALYYTDPAKTSLTLNMYEVAPGKPIIVRAEYAMDAKYAAGVSNLVISAKIPINCEFVANSVTYNNKICAYTQTPDSIEVRVPDTSGVVHFYVIPKAAGHHAFNAFARFNYDGGTFLQPIGSAAASVEAYKINVPDDTGLKNVTVTGISEPKSLVRVFDNNVEVGTTFANAVGRWQHKFDLVKPYSASYHSIYAEVTHIEAATGLNITVPTETKELYYNAAFAELTKITMFNDNSSTVFDFVNPSATTPFYVLSTNMFTFTAEFTRSDIPLVDVFVVTGDRNNDLTWVEMKYDPERELWVGTHEYDGFNIPFSIGASYDSNIPDFIFDFEMHDDMLQEMMDLIEQADMAEQLNEFYEAGETTLDDGATRVSLVSKEDGEEHFSIDYKELNFNDFSESALEADPEFFGISTSENGKLYVKSSQNGEMIIVDIANQTAYSVAFGDVDLGMFQPANIPIMRASGNYDGPLFSAYIFAVDEIGKYNNFSNTASFVKGLTGIDAAMTLFGVSQDRSMSDNLMIEMKNERQKHVDRLGKLCEHGLKNVINYHERSEMYRSLNNFLSDYTAAHRKLFDLIMLTYYAQFALTLIGVAGYASILIPIVCLGGAFALTATRNQIRNSLRNVNKVTKQWMNVCVDISFSVGGINCADDPACPTPTPTPSPSPEPSPSPTPMPTPRPYPRPKPQQNTTPITDPAGYVYEAVESNRLSGVTTTAYHDPTEQGINPILWYAEEYGQENPLITNSEGWYAWDVPFGWWKVIYEKPGYETADSVDVYGWLPVPPPQMEVHIGMVSKDAPIVVHVSGYEGFIEIMFDKYMDISTLTTSSVVLSGYGGGYAVSFADAEQDPQNPDKVYARIMRITPVSQFQLGGSIGVTIKQTAKSYAGTGLAGDYSASVQIAVKPDGIASQEKININYGGSKSVLIAVLPGESGANKKITAVSNSEYIVVVDAEAKTDANGFAEFTVTGRLPGVAEITFSLEDTQIKGSTMVKVAMPGENAEADNQTVTITATAGVGGTVTGGGKYAFGETVTLTAKSNAGFEFVGWNENSVRVSSNAVYSFITVADRSVKAEFSPIEDKDEDKDDDKDDDKDEDKDEDKGEDKGDTTTDTEKPDNTDSGSGGYAEVSIITDETISRAKMPLSSEITIFVNPFTDVREGDWFYDDVIFAYINGLFRGTETTLFSPNADMTRGMLVAVLARLDGVDLKDFTNGSFDDVDKDQYYAAAAKWAKSKGIVYGIGDNKFAPDVPISRQDFATILMRYAKYAGITLPIARGYSGFNDDADIANYAKEAIEAFFKAMIISGKPGGIFDPKGSATRAEVTAMLHRFIIK